MSMPKFHDDAREVFAFIKKNGPDLENIHVVGDWVEFHCRVEPALMLMLSGLKKKAKGDLATMIQQAKGDSK